MMAKSALPPKIIDEVISEAALPSKGAYTSLEDYDCGESKALIVAFAERLSTSTDELTRALGKHLFATFRRGHESFFRNIDGTYDLLRRIEDELHVELRKLYPQAELPTFNCSEPILGDMLLEYRSSRGLAHLAAGLIDGSIEHFSESITFTSKDLSAGHNTHVLFTLHRS